jgi:hypothetical protein
MSRDRDEFAGAERLIRAIGVSLSAGADPPPRLLGPLAETPDPMFSQIPFPDGAAPNPDEERAERFFEAVAECGLDVVIKLLQRRAPGRPAGKETPQERRDNALYFAAMKAAGGKISAARRKFIKASGLSYDTARRNFAAVHRRQK